MAHREIWFAGALTLQDMFPCMEGLLKLHDEEREKQYVFDHYEIIKFYDPETVNLLAQITNSINMGLSQRLRLPSMVFLFLDDLIFTSGEIFLPSEIEAQLRWIFEKVDQAFKERKRIMPFRALRLQEPKVYLIKSLPRYDFGRMRMAYSEFSYRQDRYNTLLYQIGRCYGFETIDTLSINTRDLLCYDEGGNGRQLSNRGKYRFWRELCQTVAEIDRSKDHDHRKRILQEELRRKKTPFHCNNQSMY